MSSLEGSLTVRKKITSTQIASALTIGMLGLGSVGVCANIFAADAQLAAGSVITIKLSDGSDYKMVATNKTDNAHTYLMGLDNACAIPGVNCVNRDGGASDSGTVYNASSMTFNNSLSGQEQSITNQTNDFFKMLPETFQHPSVTRPTAWTMNSVARSTDPTTTTGDCSITDEGCVYTAPVFLASYEEWQGGLLGYIEEPAEGSVGDTWCLARYGADDCKTTEIYKHMNFPWLRTADADSTERAWSLRGMTGYSVNMDLAWGEGGLLPAMYVKTSNVNVVSGAGTYEDPYTVTATPTPEVPRTGAAQRANDGGNLSMILSVAAVAVGAVAAVALKLVKAKKVRLSK